MDLIVALGTPTVNNNGILYRRLPLRHVIIKVKCTIRRLIPMLSNKNDYAFFFTKKLKSELQISWPPLQTPLHVVTMMPCAASVAVCTLLYSAPVSIHHNTHNGEYFSLVARSHGWAL